MCWFSIASLFCDMANFVAKAGFCDMVEFVNMAEFNDMANTGAIIANSN